MPPSCSFCGLPQADVRLLIGDHSTFICDGCVPRAEASVAAARSSGRTGAQPCSFCTAAGRAQYVGYAVRICEACTALCREIISERTPQSPLPIARIVRR
ncbi:MAG TPA: ClpX C4-type zinc finger protein [Kofleriaceae bacterium]|nr:ClpX C4-type zinc finger protein [Kofleriaceae bacterium]